MTRRDFLHLLPFHLSTFSPPFTFSPVGAPTSGAPTLVYPLWCTHSGTPTLVHPLWYAHSGAPTLKHPLWCTHQWCTHSGESLYPLESHCLHWRVIISTGESLPPLESHRLHWRVIVPTGESLTPTNLHQLSPFFHHLFFTSCIQRDIPTFCSSSPTKGLQNHNLNQINHGLDGDHETKIQQIYREVYVLEVLNSNAPTPESMPVSLSYPLNDPFLS